MSSVLSRAPILEQSSSHRRQVQRVIQFPIDQQSRVAGDFRAVEFELETAVKSHPKSILAAFTHWILRTPCPQTRKTPAFMRPNGNSLYVESTAIREIRDNSPSTLATGAGLLIAGYIFSAW